MGGRDFAAIAALAILQGVRGFGYFPGNVVHVDDSEPLTTASVRFCANPETFEASNIVDSWCAATFNTTGDQCPPGFDAYPLIRSAETYSYSYSYSYSYPYGSESDSYSYSYSYGSESDIDTYCGTEYNSCVYCYIDDIVISDADCTAALSSVPHDPLWVHHDETTCTMAAEWFPDAPELCNDYEVAEGKFTTCCSDGASACDDVWGQARGARELTSLRGERARRVARAEC